MFSSLFNRTLYLSPSALANSLPIIGDTGAFGRRLAERQPVTITVIGSSNMVRGGCHLWQNTKCSLDTRYAARSDDDNTHRGWLLQAFEAMNRSWPHPNHRLVNKAKMAAGPGQFTGCTHVHVPYDTNLLIMGFADVCFNWKDNTHDSAFFEQYESIIRTVLDREDPPTILMFNFFKFTNWGCRGQCRFWQTCESKLQELAQYYSLSVLSTRNPFFHLKPADGMFYRKWTIDNGGHFDLNMGDKYAAEMVYNFMVHSTSTRNHEWPAARGARRQLYYTGNSPHSKYYRCYDFEVDDQLSEKVGIVKGWKWEAYVKSPYSGEVKPKPGYIASKTEDSLLSIRVPQAHSYLSIIYSVFRDMGEARLSCVSRCVCNETVLKPAVNRRDTTVTLRASPMYQLKSLTNECIVHMAVRAGQAFKLNGFRVADAILS